MWETVAFVVKVRNVSQEAVELSYSQNLFGQPPAVEDSNGMRLPTEKSPWFYPVLVYKTLAAGEGIEFGDWPLMAEGLGNDLTLKILPSKAPGQVHLGQLFAVPGKYKVGYTGLRFQEPNAQSLSTGLIELVVQEDAKKKADATAWGKAVGGLQAGIGYIPGQKRSFRLGEAVPLRVLLRNVSGKPFKLQYQDGFFVEHSPTVTDALDKPATLARLPVLGGLWRRLERTLAAEEVMVFGELRLHLEPPGTKETGVPTLYATPGTYRIEYTGLPPFGISDPAWILSTGQLDLEVRDNP